MRCFLEGLGKGHNDARVTVHTKDGALVAYTYLTAPGSIRDGLALYTWTRPMYGRVPKSTGFHATM